MRFLLEKETGVFNKVDVEHNKKDIKKYIAELPNYNKVKDAELEIQQSIMKYGVDPKDNKFLDYINKVKWDLSPATADVVYQLIDNGNLEPSEKWLYSNSLYKGEPADINYKIKALVYASNKSLQKNANTQVTQDMLLDATGNVKDVDEIKSILSKITVKSEEDAGTRGIDLLKTATNSDKLNIEIVSNFVKALYSDNAKAQAIVLKYLPTPEGKNLVRSILNADYKDDDLYDDMSSLDMLKDEFKVRLNKELKLNKSPDDSKDSESASKKQSGSDLLRSKLDSYNYSDIVDYVLSTTDGRYGKRVKEFLNTVEGKDALMSILNKTDYVDNSLGDDVTPIDNLNNAIKVMINKNVIQPYIKDRTKKAVKTKKAKAKEIPLVKREAIDVLTGSGMSKELAKSLVDEMYQKGMSSEDLVLSVLKSRGK